MPSLHFWCLMPTLTFNTTNPRATEWAAKHAAKLVKGVSKTTRERIRAIITGAFEEGKDVKEIAEEIYEELDDKKRAEVIARNEVMVASNRGQEEAWAQAVDEGLLTGDELKEVIVTPDDRLCPICEPMDGRTAMIWDDFVGPDGEVLEGPPFHVQCRCVTGISAQKAEAVSKAAGGKGSGNFGHAGRPGEVGGSGDAIVVYHGTANDIIESIKVDGLVPQGSKGGDEWRGEQHVSLISGKPASVFMTGEFETALEYAERAADLRDAEPMLLEIHLPISVLGVLEDEEEPEAVRFEGKIQPEWIKRVAIGEEIFDGDFNKESDLWRALAAERVMFAVLLLKKMRALGGKGSGNFNHAGRPGEVGGSAEGSREARVERALKAHKPFTVEKDRWAAKNETLAVAMLRGQGTDNNSPVDVIVTSGGKTFGVEVKTLLDNTNDKVTVRGLALERKVRWARSNHASLHTLVIDDRGAFGQPSLYSGNRLYYRKGVGSFRLDNMVPVRNATHLRELMKIEKRQRAAGGPGSGNFDHAGRPGEVGGSAPGDGIPRDTIGRPLPGYATGISQDAVLIKRTQRYDITKAGDRRFLFNPKTGTMVFGANDTRKAEEWAHSLALGAALETGGPQNLDDLSYDAYQLRGHVFAPKGGREQEVSIYTAPDDKAERFEAISHLLEHVIKNGAPLSTLILGHDGTSTPTSIKEGWPEFRKKLPKAASVRLRIAMSFIDRALGGPGSGNFGHAGRPGEVGGSSPSELGAQDKEWLRDWTEGNTWSEVQHAARAVIDGMPRKDYVCYDCKGNDGRRYDRAQRLLEIVNASPIDKPLYRGVFNVDGGKLAVGSTFSESLSSWTGKEDLAADFAQGFYNGRGPDEYGNPGSENVLMRLVGTGMHGVNVSEHSDREPFKSADEWLTSGSYRVISRTEDEEGITLIEVERVGNAKPEGQGFRAVGGQGSGNFGHAGRPGEIGGSAPSDERLEGEQLLDTGGRPIPLRAHSIEEAIPLILAGKTVELPDVESVHTLLSELGELARAAKAAGRDAPNYNLCNVSVKGSNLFCGDKLRSEEFPDGIPRLKMPVIPGADKDDFIASLASQGITSDRQQYPASYLRASQSELIGAKVAALMLQTKFDPAESSIFVSRDNYIVDGHHRWAAVVGKDAADNELGQMQMNIIRLDAPISEIYHKARAWQKQKGIESRGAD